MDREETVRRHEAIQRALTRKFAPVLRSIIGDAMLDAALVYPARRTVFVPDDHELRVRDALTDLYAAATRAMGGDIVDTFKSGYAHLERKAEEDDPVEALYKRIWEQFLAVYGARRVVQITTATRDQIRQIIDQGLKEGLSVDEIAKLIRTKTPTFSALRSAVISRTEVHSAGMYASTEVARESRITLVKEWVSVEDGRTRDFGEADGVVDEFNHRLMNGQRAALDQPYHVPGKYGIAENLMFPGDPNGSAANVINCRCSQIYERV